MRKNTLPIYLLFILCILNACSKDVDLETSDFEPGIAENPGIVYPLENGYIGTRASSLETDWENVTHVTLPQSSSVTTPWSHLLGIPSSHNIPLDIAEDIKANDGWELIAHTMTPMADRYSNYLIFHNYLTGILKVFYYVDGNPSGNNTGFWKVEFSGNQRMLNFADEIADPVSYGGDRKSIIVSNLIKDVHKGFTKGWNCFQVELAYDPNFTTGTMSISAYNSNTQSVNITGLYSSSSTGTIITQSSNTSTGFGNKGLGTLLGEAAEKWLGDKVNNGNVKNTAQTRGVSSSIISAGIKAFSSLIGKSDSSGNYQTIQLKTEGEITLKGTITSVAASIVLPLNLSCSVAQVGALGGWNLQSSPTLLLYPQAEFLETYSRDYIYQCVGFHGVKTSVVRNPKASTKVSYSTTSYDFIQYTKYVPALSSSYNNFDGGALFNGTDHPIPSFDLVYRGTLDGNEIDVYKRNGNIKVTCEAPDVLQNGQPMRFIDLRTTYFRGGSIGFGGSKNRFVRITLNQRFNINGVETTIMNSKTFYPRFDWY